MPHFLQPCKSSPFAPCNTNSAAQSDAASQSATCTHISILCSEMAALCHSSHSQKENVDMMPPHSWKNGYWQRATDTVKTASAPRSRRALQPPNYSNSITRIPETALAYMPQQPKFLILNARQKQTNKKQASELPEGGRGTLGCRAADTVGFPTGLVYLLPLSAWSPFKPLWLQLDPRPDPSQGRARLGFAGCH